MRFEQFDQIGGHCLRQQHREPRSFDTPAIVEYLTECQLDAHPLCHQYRDIYF
jgi:hypothetical protein